jgi:hypothetical protein
VAQRSASRKSLRNEKPSHSTKHVTHSLLQDELDEDTTREEIADDVTNPFAFKWRSTPVDLRKIVPVTTAENNPVLYGNDLRVVKLPIKKQ